MIRAVISNQIEISLPQVCSELITLLFTNLKIYSILFLFEISFFLSISISHSLIRQVLQPRKCHSYMGHSDRFWLYSVLRDVTTVKYSCQCSRNVFLLWSYLQCERISTRPLVQHFHFEHMTNVTCTKWPNTKYNLKEPTYLDLFFFQATISRKVFEWIWNTVRFWKWISIPQ